MQRARAPHVFRRLIDVHLAALTIGHFITLTAPNSKMVSRRHVQRLQSCSQSSITPLMNNSSSTSGSKRGKARDSENGCNNDVPRIDVLRYPLLPPNTFPNHGYLISPLARNTKSQPVVYDVSKEENPLESFKSFEVRYSRGTRQFKSRTNNPCPTQRAENVDGIGFIGSQLE